jgi:hypothetical protein
MVSRLAAAILWALALWNTVNYRGLFWDGSSMLALLIDGGWFEWSFYPARAHVMWLTQAPVVVALKLGVSDTSILAMCYSLGLFGLPAALYQLALWRARHDLLAVTIVVVAAASVYIPTSFFIISEFHAAAAIAVAAMTIVLTTPRLTLRDGAILAVLGLVALRSYEAMIHLGLLLAVAVGWWTRRNNEQSAPARALAWLAVALFAAASAISWWTLAEYWLHPHFQTFRTSVGRFWENMQFALTLAAILPVIYLLLRSPEKMTRWWVFLPSFLPAFLLAVSSELHRLHPPTMLFAPSHYLSRATAGLFLLGLLVGWLLLVMCPQIASRVGAVLADRVVAGRLAILSLAFMVVASIPDLALTARWSSYLRAMQSFVQSHSGRISVAETPLSEQRYRDFGQDWTYPAISLLLRNAPSNAILVVPSANYGTPWNLNPDIRLPPLEGYAWRR